jgi:hypothetical protein
MDNSLVLQGSFPLLPKGSDVDKNAVLGGWPNALTHIRINSSVLRRPLSARECLGQWFIDLYGRWHPGGLFFFYSSDINKIDGSRYYITLHLAGFSLGIGSTSASPTLSPYALNADGCVGWLPVRLLSPTDKLCIASWLKVLSEKGYGIPSNVYRSEPAKQCLFKNDKKWDAAVAQAYNQITMLLPLEKSATVVIPDEEEEEEEDPFDGEYNIEHWAQ